MRRSKRGDEPRHQEDMGHREEKELKQLKGVKRIKGTQVGKNEENKTRGEVVSAWR